MSSQSLESLSYKQLKERCVMEGVSARGTKKQLLIALRAKLNAPQPPPSSNINSTMNISHIRGRSNRSQTVIPQTKHKQWNSTTQPIQNKRSTFIHKHPPPNRSIPQRPIPSQSITDNHMKKNMYTRPTTQAYQPFVRRKRSRSIAGPKVQFSIQMDNDDSDDDILESIPKTAPIAKQGSVPPPNYKSLQQLQDIPPPPNKPYPKMNKSTKATSAPGMYLLCDIFYLFCLFHTNYSVY